jgi:hypothetical protein
MNDRHAARKALWLARSALLAGRKKSSLAQFRDVPTQGSFAMWQVDWLATAKCRAATAASVAIPLAIDSDFHDSA